MAGHIARSFPLYYAIQILNKRYSPIKRLTLLFLHIIRRAASSADNARYRRRAAGSPHHRRQTAGNLHHRRQRLLSRFPVRARGDPVPAGLPAAAAAAKLAQSGSENPLPDHLRIQRVRRRLLHMKEMKLAGGSRDLIHKKLHIKSPDQKRPLLLHVLHRAAGRNPSPQAPPPRPSPATLLGHGCSMLRAFCVIPALAKQLSRPADRHRKYFRKKGGSQRGWDNRTDTAPRCPPHPRRTTKTLVHISSAPDGVRQDAAPSPADAAAVRIGGIADKQE